jgi:hypothetical protein
MLTRDLRADEVAYRIGATSVRPRVYPKPRGLPSAQSMARRQLLRDTAVALAGIAIVAVVAVNLAPRPDGEVLAATGTPTVVGSSSADPSPLP